MTKAARRVRDRAFLEAYAALAKTVTLLVAITESPWWQEQAATERAEQEGE